MRTVYKLSSALLLLFLLAACGPTGGVPTSGPHVAPTPTSTAMPTLTPPPHTPAPPPVTPQPPVKPTALPDDIVIEVPPSGATVSSPVKVKGSVLLIPFENTLRGRVYDAQGHVVGEGPIEVVGEIPGPGTFAGQIPFSISSTGPGKVEIADISPKDGTVEFSATVDVVLVAEPVSGTIEIPAAGARATLPLHILARAGLPGEEVTATLRWQDGSELSRTYTLLRGEDGKGLLIESLWWIGDVPPPFPPTQPAALEVRSLDGTLLARQEITIVSWDDRDTLDVAVYFLLGETPTPLQIRIPRTVRVGTAALEELLWGPPVYSEAGLQTAIPLPQEVLEYPGRGPDWGPRVRLLSLTIENRVATADFSGELKAYGGGSARVLAIREQITRTLLEFPTVDEVIIAIEGQTEGILEP